MTPEEQAARLDAMRRALAKANGEDVAPKPEE